jgi:hypothetical protein
MLGVSLMITVLTETISTLVNLRGRSLMTGLATLFGEVSAKPELNSKLAKAILMHPLLADGLVRPALAPAIRKSELLAALEKAVERNADLATFATELDKLKKTTEEWFDSVMDRVSHRFANSIRLITIAASFVLAFALHLDSLTLLNQLSTDADLRASVLLTSADMSRRADLLMNGGSGESAKSTAELTGELRQIRGDFDKSSFQLVPSPYPGWDYVGAFDRRLWGVVASAVLLSLGAPFWFNLLKTLTGLRPMLASKVDDDAGTSPHG